VRSAIRNTYDASEQSKSPGVRRTEELRQLASEGVPVVFESRECTCYSCAANCRRQQSFEPSGQFQGYLAARFAQEHGAASAAACFRSGAEIKCGGAYGFVCAAAFGPYSDRGRCRRRRHQRSSFEQSRDQGERDCISCRLRRVPRSHYSRSNQGVPIRVRRRNLQ
jgi:hypothetical protein